MSDPEIRRLERALAADPSDAVALEALAAAALFEFWVAAEKAVGERP